MGMLAPRSLHHLHRPFDQMGHHGLVHVFAGAARTLENDGGFRLDAADDDGLELLQVVEIVGRHGIVPGHGLSETSPGYSPVRVLYNEIEPLSGLLWRRYSVRGPWPNLTAVAALPGAPLELTWSAKVLKFSANMPASFLAWASYAALSFQVFRGLRISAGTPGHSVGTARPKRGSVDHGHLGE